MKLLCCVLTSLCIILLIEPNPVQAAVSTACDKERSKNCIISFLVPANPSDDVNLPDLRSKTSLTVLNGSLAVFSERLSKQLGTVGKLHLGPLELREFFLKPELLELIARGNRIEQVILKPTVAEYKLELLDLSDNRMKNLNGFEVLINLKELHLEGNSLQSIDMRVFGDMSNLEKLYLDRNHLSTVVAIEPIELPALEFLSLSGNKLTSLEVSMWHLDSLTEFNVSSNDLVHIDGLETFSSLQTIRLTENWWDCSWLKDALDVFSKHSVAIAGRDGNCEGKQNVANICCVPVVESNLTSEDELSRLNSLKQKQESLRKTLMDEFEKIQGNQEKQLKNLDKELDDLEKKAEKWLPISASDSLTKKEFVKLKQRVLELKSSLQQECKELTKQKDQNNRSKHRLQQTIADQNRLLDREMRKISESQAQFELLRDYVNSMLKKRN